MFQTNQTKVQPTEQNKNINTAITNNSVLQNTDFFLAKTNISLEMLNG